MGIIKCPACWQEINDKESICPYCGFVLRMTHNNSIQNNEMPSNNAATSDYKNIFFEPTDTDRALGKVAPNRNKVIISVAAVIIFLIFISQCFSDNEQNKGSERYSNANEDYFEYSGEKGAANKAKSYLNTMAFSKSGLIKQLEFEGFTEEEAQYGVDNCGADWKGQALKKAKSYLNTMAFSKSGLRAQLEFEGFTEEEAIYGTENCGADWKEQAVKKAKSYLNIMSFSKNGLISQLEFEGFSEEEAQYGVNHCGAKW